MKRGTVELPPRPEPPLPVAISECLTGRAVRYDGTDARSAFPHDAVKSVLSFVPICPEVGIGLGVPRPPIQLVGDPQAPRVLGVLDPGVDVTEALRSHAQSRSAQLDGVYGYVFMERSPSCGLYSVPVHAATGEEPPYPKGRGAHAQAVLELYPDLPVEENGRLFDEELRESFLNRVFAYAHWQRLCDGELSPARLMAFHSQYKYLLMAHSVPHYRQAGRLLGGAGDAACRTQDAAARPTADAAAAPPLFSATNAAPGAAGKPAADAAAAPPLFSATNAAPGAAGKPTADAPAGPSLFSASGSPQDTAGTTNIANGQAAQYLRCLMSGLAKPATRGGHANVLAHLQGYLSPHLNSTDRGALTELIDSYRRGAVPLAEPRELLLRHLAEHPDPYLARQVYLGPIIS